MNQTMKVTGHAGRPQRLRLGALLLSTLWLAACGGGGGGAETAASTEPVGGQATDQSVLPASALTDGDAFTAFVAGQARTERVTPMALGDSPAPGSDTAQPQQLN